MKDGWWRKRGTVNAVLIYLCLLMVCYVHDATVPQLGQRRHLLIHEALLLMATRNLKVLIMQNETMVRARRNAICPSAVSRGSTLRRGQF